MPNKKKEKKVTAKVGKKTSKKTKQVNNRSKGDNWNKGNISKSKSIVRINNAPYIHVSGGSGGSAPVHVAPAHPVPFSPYLPGSLFGAERTVPSAAPPSRSLEVNPRPQFVRPTAPPNTVASSSVPSTVEDSIPDDVSVLSGPSFDLSGQTQSFKAVQQPSLSSEKTPRSREPSIIQSVNETKSDKQPSVYVESVDPSEPSLKAQSLPSSENERPSSIFTARGQRPSVPSIPVKSEPNLEPRVDKSDANVIPLVKAEAPPRVPRNPTAWREILKKEKEKVNQAGARHEHERKMKGVADEMKDYHAKMKQALKDYQGYQKRKKQAEKLLPAVLKNKADKIFAAEKQAFQEKNRILEERDKKRSEAAILLARKKKERDERRAALAEKTRLKKQADEAAKQYVLQGILDNHKPREREKSKRPPENIGTGYRTSKYAEEFRQATAKKIQNVRRVNTAKAKKERREAAYQELQQLPHRLPLSRTGEGAGLEKPPARRKPPLFGEFAHEMLGDLGQTLAPHNRTVVM